MANDLLTRPECRTVTIGIALHQAEDGPVTWEQFSNYVGKAPASPQLNQAVTDWWEAFASFERKYQASRE